jgi:hypothetical protein
MRAGLWEAAVVLNLMAASNSGECDSVLESQRQAYTEPERRAAVAQDVGTGV